MFGSLVVVVLFFFWIPRIPTFLLSISTLSSLKEQDSSYHSLDQYWLYETFEQKYVSLLGKSCERLQWGRKARAQWLWMVLCGRVWGRGDVCGC